MDAVTHARNVEYLDRQLGSVLRGLLKEPNIEEIMVNPDGSVWVQRHGQKQERLQYRCDGAQREGVVCAVAAFLSTVATREHPVVQGDLPFTKHRFHGILPPVSPEGPCFTIRKHEAQHLTIDDYVRDGVLKPWQAMVLYEAIRQEETILISGGVRSGKTTLANALLTEMARSDDVRFVIIEDTGELQCRAANVVALRTSETASLRQLVGDALRLNPDRIIVGEVRKAEALEMLKGWNTGQRGGLTTIHANSAVDVYLRLQTLVAEAGGAVLSPALFATAINLVVHIEVDEKEVRRVTEMVRVVPEGQSFTLVPLTEGGLS